MPLLDRWGLVLAGHVGPRENLLTVVLDSSGSDSVEESERTMEDAIDQDIHLIVANNTPCFLLKGTKPMDLFSIAHMDLATACTWIWRNRSTSEG